MIEFDTFNPREGVDRGLHVSLQVLQIALI